MGTHLHKGIRYGGRAKGTKNKATVERELILSGGREGVPLAKEVMEEIMLDYLELKRRATPLPGEEATPEQKAEMQRWGDKAADVGAKLAPYQSATYKAILMPDQHLANELITDVVFRIFERERKPLLIEHSKANGKGE